MIPFRISCRCMYSRAVQFTQFLSMPLKSFSRISYSGCFVCFKKTDWLWRDTECQGNSQTSPSQQTDSEVPTWGFHNLFPSHTSDCFTRTPDMSADVLRHGKISKEKNERKLSLYLLLFSLFGLHGWKLLLKVILDKSISKINRMWWSPSEQTLR